MLYLYKIIIVEHYAHLLDKPFYPDFERFMASGPVFGMMIEEEKVYNHAEHESEEQRLEEEYNDDYFEQTAAGEPINGQQPIPFIGVKTVNLLVNGDSMESEFFDSDIIKYHRQPELENGEIGVFAVNGGITMKKLRKNSDVRLESLNEKDVRLISLNKKIRRYCHIRNR